MSLMPRQEAYIFTHWIRDVQGRGVPAIASLLDYAAGEKYALARDFFVYGTPNATNLVIIIAEAQDTRLSLLNGSTHYLAAVRNLESETPTNRWLNDVLSAAEVTALAAWITTKTGFTNTQIANWFGVTPAQMSNFLQTNPRSESFERLYRAWREWRN